MLEINNIYQGNSLELLKQLEDNSIDSIVTDPPYELGFMGKSWDSTGIAYSTDLWKECLRVLKPGGHLLSFGGTRTYHRMACAIEDAGFEIRDQIQWIYGSGFPKSQNISKELEKRRGKSDVGKWIKERMKELNLDKKQVAIYCGVTPRQIDHWIGENTPCPQLPKEKKYLLLEEVLQDKPIWRENFISKKGDVIGEITHQRSGGDDFGKIVGSESNHRTETVHSLATDEAKQWQGWGTALKPANEPIVMARKLIQERTIASNVLVWGTGGINIDDCRVEFAENDDPRIGKDYIHNAKAGLENGTHKDNSKGESQQLHKESGRFPANVIFDEKAAAILDKQSGLLKSGKNAVRRQEGFFLEHGGLGKAGDVQTTYGDSGGASRFFYCAKAAKSEKGKFNTHPTVKPIKLMEYLVRLVTPENGTVLDPFAGSGTTLLACINMKKNYIGFELNQEYVDIINQRIHIVG